VGRTQPVPDAVAADLAVLGAGAAVVAALRRGATWRSEGKLVRIETDGREQAQSSGSERSRSLVLTTAQDVEAAVVLRNRGEAPTTNLTLSRGDAAWVPANLDLRRTSMEDVISAQFSTTASA
jgi:hypothetical protein